MNIEKIRESLDYGLDRIDAGTLDQLRSARYAALSHYRSHALAMEGHGEFHFRHPKVGVWMPAAALVLGICAILYWGTLNETPAPDSSDDAALLADDLPVPAYTDQKFFDAWLNRSQQ